MVRKDRSISQREGFRAHSLYFSRRATAAGSRDVRVRGPQPGKRRTPSIICDLRVSLQNFTFCSCPFSVHPRILIRFLIVHPRIHACASLDPYSCAHPHHGHNTKVPSPGSVVHFSGLCHHVTVANELAIDLDTVIFNLALLCVSPSSHVLMYRTAGCQR